MLPWFFMFLRSHLKKSYLFQCLLTGLERERSQSPVSPARVLGISQTFFMGVLVPLLFWGCSTPPGAEGAEIRTVHLLSIPESQSGYGEPLINFPWGSALKFSRLCSSAESSQLLISVLSAGLCPFVGGSCVPSAGEFGVLATGCEYAGVSSLCGYSDEAGVVVRGNKLTHPFLI